MDDRIIGNQQHKPLMGMFNKELELSIAAVLDKQFPDVGFYASHYHEERVRILWLDGPMHDEVVNAYHALLRDRVDGRINSIDFSRIYSYELMEQVLPLVPGYDDHDLQIFGKSEKVFRHGHTPFGCPPSVDVGSVWWGDKFGYKSSLRSSSLYVNPNEDTEEPLPDSGYAEFLYSSKGSKFRKEIEYRVI